MRLSLGSTGCQPVVFGSLPKNFFRHHFTKGVALFAGKLPATAGWQPALPRTEDSSFVITSSFVIRISSF